MTGNPATAVAGLWRGEVPLGEAFWVWAVLGAAVVNFGTSALFLALVSMEMALLAWIAGYALSIPYNVLALVGVWRSAERYEEAEGGSPRLALAARSVSLVGLVMISLF